MDVDGAAAGDSGAAVEFKTVHVEGLSEYTREEQIAALFSLYGFGTVAANLLVQCDF